MKKHTLFSILLLALLGTFLFCGDDDNGTTPDETPDPTVLAGTWEDTISYAGAGLQSTIVGIALSQGVRSYANTFEIYSRDSAKTTHNYKHKGTWQIANGNITLTGNSIEMWDANGTAISNIPDSIANKEYVLDTSRTYGTTPATWGGSGNDIIIQDISCAGGIGVCLGMSFNTTFVDMVKATNLSLKKK